MSVAFRRDSDEEHKEPRFELPLPAGPNLVTRKGLAQIASQVAHLEAQVAGGGDEAAVTVAKRELRYWRTRLATAQVAPPAPAGQAGFGSRVRFRLNGAARIIDIVGGDEADPANGRLAFTAPLAKALIGGEAGEVLDFGDKADAIEIVAIEVIPE
ncbi:GreA/GreB family elongation factor [Sphingobium boeckii]|uniref:Transcription elongation GreA/GreB family factor n=1 Tax=Sphingobium boeckii TaxID=1082345 RepID=A0A7W9ECW6_9SPHN|nr:GreA/GreB family elongation factor [Sphingobium boeckii]MBB5684693.1 transcription elongation GreA/GreB family factor [Sphingobium boeckii]